MVRIENDTLATIEFVLRWSDGNACHEDRYLARRVNLWRDIFPTYLRGKIKGSKQGDVITVNYKPGELVPPYSESLIHEIPFRMFASRKFADIEIVPAKGRFLPKGMVSGINGVYPQTISPFRVLDIDDSSFTADFNHPFSTYPVTLECHIQNVALKECETGGRLYHWGEELCDYGPGMQSSLAGHPTDFICNGFYGRSDDRSDKFFYEKIRHVGHIDSQASANLKQIYSRFVKSEMKVLDLMSSVESHLPDDINLEVTGLGLNLDELNLNPVLKHKVRQDLNENPDFSFESEEFDAVVCSLSIEYLIRPEEVFKNIYNALRPDGTLLIGISNRWFPTKVTNGWLTLHEYERMAYLRQLAEQAGFNGSWGTVVVRNDWRPVTDKHFVATRGVSDPVYVVWCKK